MFNSMSQMLALKASKYVDNKESVCDIGSQTLTKSSEKTIARYSDFDIDLTKINDVCGLYKAIGFKKYHNIDIAKHNENTIVQDLNYALTNIDQQYDLVTNNGTLEHIFNQYAVLKNMHDLCKKDGVMFHLVPFTGWIDHGLYNYNPNFFTALAKANKYEILYTGFGETSGEHSIPVEFEVSKKRSYSRDDYEEKIKDWEYDPFIIVIYRKIVEEEFKIPMQEIYEV